MPRAVPHFIAPVFLVSGNIITRVMVMDAADDDYCNHKDNDFACVVGHGAEDTCYIVVYL
jgi:hypothetical protein